MDDFKPASTPDNNPTPPPPGSYPPGQLPYYAPPPPEDMGTAKVVGLSALACCIPLIGPIISLIFGINERAKRGAVVVIVIAGISLLLLPVYGIVAAIALPFMMLAAPESVQHEYFENAMGDSYVKVQDKAKEAECKANLYNIQLNLEIYLVDHEGKYPDSFETLIELGYIDELPRNPFTESPMQIVDLSDSPEAKQGNFAFLPKITDGKVTGYKLLGFGSINTTDSLYPEGAGPAAVVITLEGGS